MTKKDYMKPTMKIVELRRKSHLLAVSSNPQSYDGKRVSVYYDDEMSKEEDVW